ncbi:MAG: SH3 domain-containing protein, partial [Candidatus Riflebacteria bacterium]|nr:SH3 domain-containing protein [Candidatus Riflebacteria bacterium]
MTRRNHVRVTLLVLLLGTVLGNWAAFAQCSDKPEVFVQFDLNIPGVCEEMLYPAFWLKNVADQSQVIMNSAEIERYNRKSFGDCEVLKDLRTFPAAMNGEQLRQSIEKVSVRPKNKRYLNGEEVTDEYFEKLEDLLNLDQVNNLTRVKFGITVKRTEMRAFPTYDRVFSEPADFESDMFIETALYAAEPLAVLHESRDGKWLFAQSYNYRAWLPAADVAFTSRKELFKYLNAPDFLVVTGKGVFTGYNPVHPEISELQLDMGAMVPLAARSEISMDIDGQHPAGNYVVKLPARGADGLLEFRIGLIARSEDVRVGYMPLTRKNIITQAFKFLGQRYGWGGMFNTRDCSAFIMDIYRSMGIMLPRNSGEQGKVAVGIMHSFSKEMTLDERMAIFNRLPAGTPIYMAGHAMLYLGRYNDDYYIIHDFAGFRVPDAEGKLTRSTTRC